MGMLFMTVEVHTKFFNIIHWKVQQIDTSVLKTIVIPIIWFDWEICGVFF